jgi:hypothetical protein
VPKPTLVINAGDSGRGGHIVSCWVAPAGGEVAVASRSLGASRNSPALPSRSRRNSTIVTGPGPGVHSFTKEPCISKIHNIRTLLELKAKLQ